VTSDVRLLDVPMRPLVCTRCSATVQVRKASWEQTSVQWDQAALRTCIEREQAHTEGPFPFVFSGCRTLGESIRAEADAGRLPLACGPVPVAQ
jgi:YD repeat-containing protein